MTNRDHILKAVNFIESNLKSDINVSDIARESCCSHYHFIRLFQSIVGTSPKKYLLQRRLTECAKTIQKSDEKIMNVAFEYQFGSHEVFTRAFQKQFGTSPSRIKKGEAPPTHLLTQPVTKAYLFESKKARNQPPVLVERAEQLLIGHSYFIKGDLDGLELSNEWNALMKAVPLINHRASPEDFFQIQYWAENQDMNGTHFFLGTAVNILKDVNPQFVAKVIPKGTYLKFVHKGLSKNVGYTYRYIYGEFLPNSNYQLKLPFNFECYGANYSSPYSEQSESHIFIPVSG